MGQIFGLLVTLVPIVGGLAIAGYAIWTNHQRKMAELMTQQAAEDAAHYSAENAKLEARLRVLERIITDKGFETALAIEELRDGPARLTPRDDAKN